MRKRRKLGWVIGGALLAFFLLWGIGRLVGGSKALRVEVDTVRRQTLLPFITETAILRPISEVPISPDISGEVIQIYVREGDTVRRGQLLFTIRPDNYQTAVLQMQAVLAEARAQYAAARANLAQQEVAAVQESLAYQRALQLKARGAISEAELDNAHFRYRLVQAQLQAARSNVEAAFYRIQSTEANLRRAQLDLQRTSVYASMDGIITRLNVRVGQRVVGVGQMAGTESLRIADLSQLVAEAQISENDVIRLHVGDSVVVEPQAYPGLRWPGRVIRVGYSSGRSASGSEASNPLSIEEARTYLVQVLIDSAAYDPRQYPLRPEMSALVHIFYDRREGVLTVPLQAVVLREGKEGVFVVENGRARWRAVRLGPSDDQRVEIQSGLKANEIIVVGPYEVLQTVLQDSVAVQPKRPL
ncbi:MAG: efflux RND transporter periplasmic adaptor subunit [Bacteroidia bacterium]|nr:efflux RND transporter periplasmic adaptor subunit [Bacteroidia bacterium]MDW8088249.1 efflux RND transporter periplasmic adaptor subunit [Bacteroidia bacterium]